MLILLRCAFTANLRFSTCSFSSACKRNPFSHPLRPPSPKKIPFAVSAQGRTWEDPYHWMCNTDDPDLQAYLNHENSYAEAFMAGSENLQRELVEEMKSRMPSQISTPPERWGPWLYYQYIPTGKEYPILCRKLWNHNALFKTLLGFIRGQRNVEILLDWNEIAEQFGYVHIGTCRVSPDHNFLAYTLDITGGESFVLQIKDIKTGSMIPNSRVEGVINMAWAKNSHNLLYTISDKTQRPYKVLSKNLGSDDADTLLYMESDLSCCVDITCTKDGKFITINSNSRNSSEVYAIDATDLQSGLRQVRKRVPGVQYFVEHHYGFFYILTNSLSAVTGSIDEDYHLARCRAEGLQLGNWQDIIQAGHGVGFQDMDIFHGHLVLFLQREGCPMLCSINMPLDNNFKHPRNLEDLNPWFFPLPSSTCNITPGSNHDFRRSIYRVVLSSPLIPDVIADYDMLRQKFTIVKQEEVVGITGNTGSNSLLGAHFHPDNNSLHNINKCQNWSDLSEAFVCERKEIVSHDGVSVPLTILYSHKAQKNGQCPGILQGYGAYGEILDKSWCSDRISLLDRGWVLAFADVRGGGGGGVPWHRSGTGLSKLNSIYDFLACGRYLVNEGYVHKDRLGAIGFSAGGLLVGTAINMYPDLFSAAILKVPFLDICNTLLDPSLPLTVLDYEEFGDPKIRTEFDFIRSYSPYDNISPGDCYPSMLVTASFHDSRVGVWEAAKWVAKVREDTCLSCSRSVILKTNMSGGHFGEGGRFRHCEETAFEYAFLIKVMEMHFAEQAGSVTVVK